MQFLGHSVESWVVFHLIIAALLALDLGVANRRAHVIRPKEALLWSFFWIALGVAFGGWIYFSAGPADATLYWTGYVVEKSLSVDNLFVFYVIFAAFQIQPQYQHRLLFWGVLGAIVLRAVLILLGTSLLTQFEWLIYLFGAFLLYTAYNIARGGAESLNPKETLAFRALKKFLPLSDAPYTGVFFLKENGKTVVSMGFAALVVIEISDVVFAVDSIPAVMGVTRDPFLVYTSNIFAILGLRSLYFLLENALDRFHLLKYGLAVVLGYVGLKMLLDHVVHIEPLVNLTIVLGTLGLALLASLWTTRPEKQS